MKIIHDKPPVWDEVCAMIGATPKNAIFAWGDVIYNPDDMPVPDYLIAHEEVHQRQQSEMGGPEAWWARYIADPYWRIQQEVEAYAAQYAFMCRREKGRNRRNIILRNVSASLAGPLYGNMLTHGKALLMIKGRALKLGV